MDKLAPIQLNYRNPPSGDFVIKATDVKRVDAHNPTAGSNITCYDGSYYEVTETATEVHNLIQGRWTAYLTALTGV